MFDSIAHFFLYGRSNFQVQLVLLLKFLNFYHNSVFKKTSSRFIQAFTFQKPALL